MFSKILTFEFGWFDEDQNSTGSICPRLAKEANVVCLLNFILNIYFMLEIYYIKIRRVINFQFCIEF